MAKLRVQKLTTCNGQTILKGKQITQQFSSRKLWVFKVLGRWCPKAGKSSLDEQIRHCLLLYVSLVLPFESSEILRCSGVQVFTSRCSGVHHVFWFSRRDVPVKFVDFAEETLNFYFNTLPPHIDKVLFRGEEGIAQNLGVTIPYGQSNMGKSSNVQTSLKSSSKFHSTFRADKCRH